MSKDYFVIGALSSETQEVVYMTQDGSSTSALYRAYQYPTFNKAAEDRELLQKSITASYGRFLELLQDNAMYPVYTPGAKEFHRTVYEDGLRIFSVNISVEEVS